MYSKKFSILIYAITAVLFLLVSATACDKKEEEEDQVDYGSVSDVDGNTYKTRKIGSQTWMVENLKTTKFNDGAGIPNVTGKNEWKNLSSAAYSWYDNDKSSYSRKCGALYNWYAVEQGKLCPNGWRVARDSEWKELVDFLAGEGHEAEQGKVLRSTSDWNDGKNGSDDYYFNGKPAGFRHVSDGGFYAIGTNAQWWTSSESYEGEAWFYAIYHTGTDIRLKSEAHEQGHSVRCIKK
ncbi:MAG: FISUMP domain-containing protein [Bacteroidales bacterium]